jgi:arylsulfatase A-like enzyme
MFFSIPSLRAPLLLRPARCLAPSTPIVESINKPRLRQALGAVALGALIFATPAIAESSTEAVPKPPNIIYILVDDLGYGDLSCYGQKKFLTLNIDRLATEGMKFTDHYSGSTVCSPSRACLMTGQHPGRVHCRGNGDENSYTKLDPAMTTLPRLLKNAGFATGAFGKWGLGDTSTPGATNPLAHGFDTFSGWKNQTIAHTYYPKSIVRDGEEVPLNSGTYIHDLIMDDAFAFIEKNAKSGTPFFCYIPTAIPHAAMHAPADLHGKWRKVFPQFDKKIGKYNAGPNAPCPDVQNPIAGFAAMMEKLDGDVGRLLAHLKELGIDDNTVVLFASDNGAHREGGHNPEFWDSNGPFKGHKRDLYEGGIRSPFLVRWPGTIAPGSTSTHISAFWDVLPTMAEITGQPVPERVNGLSFLPTLLGDSGAQQQPPYLYWEHPQTTDHDWAVRTGPWKGVFRGWKNNGEKSTTPRLEIYNLDTDPGETTDLAATHPEIVERFQKIRAEAHSEPVAN